jgi:hypothetical protein
VLFICLSDLVRADLDSCLDGMSATKPPAHVK